MNDNAEKGILPLLSEDSKPNQILVKDHLYGKHTETYMHAYTWVVDMGWKYTTS